MKGHKQLFGNVWGKNKKILKLLIRQDGKLAKIITCYDSRRANWFL